MMDKLKPCPFCGGESKYSKTAKGYHVTCTVCGGDVMAYSMDHPSSNKLVDLKARAKDKWNARTNESPWIGVEDELPEDRTNVIAACDDDVCECYVVNYGDGNFYFETITGVAFSATHWMPMPEPPK